MPLGVGVLLTGVLSVDGPAGARSTPIGQDSIVAGQPYTGDFPDPWILRTGKRYHAYSKGQLPAIFTPYKTATTWKGNRFDNTKIKSIGWKQLVPTSEGMRRTFEWLKAHPRSK